MAPARGYSIARIRRALGVRFAHGDSTCPRNLGTALLTMALTAPLAGPASAFDIGPGTAEAQAQSAFEPSGPNEEPVSAVRPMHTGEHANTRAKPGRSIGRGLPKRIDGRAYAWRDGTRPKTAILQPNLTVERIGATAADGTPASAYRIVAKDGAQDGLPVFRSAAGDLMMLPGGVLLVLDATWSAVQADGFLAARGIDRADVEGLRWAKNAFFVPTEPGFAALDLANALAGEAGVVLASPNWWTEAALK